MVVGCVLTGNFGPQEKTGFPGCERGIGAGSESWGRIREMLQGVAHGSTGDADQTVQGSLSSMTRKIAAEMAVLPTVRTTNAVRFLGAKRPKLTNKRESQNTRISSSGNGNCPWACSISSHRSCPEIVGQLLGLGEQPLLDVVMRGQRPDLVLNQFHTPRLLSKAVSEEVPVDSPGQTCSMPPGHRPLQLVTGRLGLRTHARLRARSNRMILALPWTIPVLMPSCRNSWLNSPKSGAPGPSTWRWCPH